MKIREVNWRNLPHINVQVEADKREFSLCLVGIHLVSVYLCLSKNMVTSFLGLLSPLGAGQGSGRQSTLLGKEIKCFSRRSPAWSQTLTQKYSQSYKWRHWPCLCFSENCFFVWCNITQIWANMRASLLPFSHILLICTLLHVFITAKSRLINYSSCLAKCQMHWRLVTWGSVGPQSRQLLKNSHTTQLKIRSFL